MNSVCVLAAAHTDFEDDFMTTNEPRKPLAWVNSFQKWVLKPINFWDIQFTSIFWLLHQVLLV